MKYLIFLLIVLSFSSFRASIDDSLVWVKKHELSIDKDVVWGVDLQGSIYVSKRNTISKYDSTFQLKFVQSIKSLGEIKCISPVNAMKIFLFSEDQQRVCLFDNTLTLSDECIYLNDLNVDFAQFVASSAQSDRLWIFDQLNSKLMILNLKSKTISQTSNLKGLLVIEQIKGMLEVGNELFLYDPSKGVYKFDLYGTFTKFYEFINSNDFFVFGENIMFLKENSLTLVNLFDEKTKEIALPIDNVIGIKVFGNTVFIQTVDKILAYSIKLS